MIVTVAATQMACSWDRSDNLDRAETLVRAAAGAGAQIILPQEMVLTHFFGFNDRKPISFALAETVDGPPVSHMRALRVIWAS